MVAISEFRHPLEDYNPSRTTRSWDVWQAQWEAAADSWQARSGLLYHIFDDFGETESEELAARIRFLLRLADGHDNKPDHWNSHPAEILKRIAADILAHKIFAHRIRTQQSQQFGWWDLLFIPNVIDDLVWYFRPAVGTEPEKGLSKLVRNLPNSSFGGRTANLTRAFARALAQQSLGFVDRARDYGPHRDITEHAADFLHLALEFDDLSLLLSCDDRVRYTALPRLRELALDRRYTPGWLTTPETCGDPWPSAEEAMARGSQAGQVLFLIESTNSWWNEQRRPISRD